jgi:hypothetical protein
MKCPRCGKDNPAEVARQLLDYNPDTGVFTWAVTTNNRAPKGSVAGATQANRTTSYRKIRFNGVTYYAHRLAWMLHFGSIPEGMVIDHVNGNGLDNRLSNLRLCTQAENSRNRTGRSASEKPKGITFDKSRGKWAAQIKKDYKLIHLGRFDTAEAAHHAYTQAAKELFGDYIRA